MSVLGDAVRDFEKMGARRIPGKELRDIHGIYAYLMMMEEVKKGGPMGLTVEKQLFVGAGGYIEKDKLVLQRAMLAMAEIQNIPIIIIVYGYFTPQIRIFHPDEILTKHRDDVKQIFGVVGIEFSISLGEKIDSLGGLREKWMQIIGSWTERKKEYHSKQIQRKLT